MTQPAPPAAIQTEYLTAALRKSGALGDAAVHEVKVEYDRPTLLSRILRLRLTYQGKAPDAPATIICKLGLMTDAEWSGGQREVAFYTQVAPVLSGSVVPRCFDAQWDADTRNWHLLLEDLTDTHHLATEWPLPPSQAQCEAILTAHARLHAAWWDDPRLGVSVGRWPDANDAAQILRRLRGNFTSFADRLGDNLSAERRDLFERFLDAAPRLAARHRTHRNITIIQGDSHVWNCFLPRDGSTDVRLFDWDFWSLHPATNDLSYMMAMHWYPDRRRQMERPLLDHYHAVLLAHGVTGYDRHALHDDYRLSTLSRIAIPVLQASIHQIPPVIWWNNLERILMAVDDLGCRELLG